MSALAPAPGLVSRRYVDGGWEPSLVTSVNFTSDYDVQPAGEDALLLVRDTGQLIWYRANP